MKIIKILLALLLLCACSSFESEDIVLKDNKQVNHVVSFNAVGDNLIHKRLIDEAKKGNTYDFTSYYQNIKPYIKKADISFINQETILAGKQRGYSGYPVFNTPDEMAKALYDTGFDVVNGSNNHALDKGEDGMTHSIETFNQYDMKYIGLRENDIPVIEKNGVKISFLSYNQSLNYNQQSNSLKNFDKTQIKNDVKKAKSISDVVIVSCHWGIEYDNEPQPFQKEYASYLADLGVDVIIGTHPHTLQPIQWVQGQNGHKTLVAYSLGNFISGMLEENVQLGGMLSFDIVKKSHSISIENVTLTPLVNHYQAHSENVYNSRYGFKVYRLKDYTETLSAQHGINGYKGRFISIEKMKNRAKSLAGKNINVDM
jgi:Putative enzyme of poly-gamma-glutamate biosynthesis (capsule formation)